MKSYITGFNEEKLKEIKTHPYFEKKREELRSRAEKYFETEPPRFKFSDMHLFVTTGNRTNYERVYNEYTGRLAAFSNAYLILGEEKYIEEIGNTVWSICDLETWGLPAHVLESYPIDHRRCFLELCSVNVGRYFGEILSFMEDKLPELVVKRMKHEVRERIIEGFKKYEFGWKYGTNNWTAVCVAGILASYIYFAEENEVNEMIPTFLEIADRYLMGFDNDGCCMEGYAYWAYGFSYYCYFADLLKNYTNGKIDLFSDPRVHAIAKFQENCAINDTQCIRFSDCGEHFKPAPFLSHFLKNVYPDVQIPSLELDDSSAISLRDFLWPDPALAVSTMKPESKIYREAQWFIYRSDAYNFACKAGCNAESHNHNDVGSFMISKGGRVTFTDPGTGNYTRQYFGAERYTILEPSARSHSLPIINGELQRENLKEKSKIYIERENEYAFSMENAYVIPTLVSLTRHFTCTESGIELSDSYEFSEMPSSVIERFSTLVEPSVEAGRVLCGKTVLEFDESLYEVKVSTENCMRSSRTGTPLAEPLYMVDLIAKSLSKKMECKFRFT